MVLHLLRRIGPVALVTTHFLDFAAQLQSRSARDGLSFLQAEIDEDQGPTFRFVPGVATTSLAVGTARRLGVTFDELERILEDRLTKADGRRSEDVDELTAGNDRE
jgi:DNA mismatch repair protein MutS2